MNKKENYIIKKTYTVNENMKQELIKYLSVGSMKIVEQEPEAGVKYLVAYTTIGPDTKPFTILKNNQFVEPFNRYYQNLITLSNEIIDINAFFLTKKIEELHLSYKDIGYLKCRYPQIKTVEDFLNAKYYLIDPNMEYVKNILMTFEAITCIVIKIKKDEQIPVNTNLESNMSEKEKTMATRLRQNQQQNLQNYQKQQEKSERRIEKLEQLAEENFKETTELRKKHLKAQQEHEEIDQTLQEFIRKDILPLTIEEQDRLLAQEFISSSIVTRDIINLLYCQIRLIHKAIDFSKLKQYACQRLAKATDDTHHDLCMEIDDDKDGIYKYVQISSEHMTTSIEQCKNLTNEYCIFEKIEFCDEEEIYFSRTLLKTNYPKNEEFIPLAHKKWIYNGNALTPFEEIETENYTTFDFTDLQKLEEIQKDKKEQYIKCLSKNK